MFTGLLMAVTDITGKHKRLEERLQRKQKREEELLIEQDKISENVQQIMKFVSTLESMVIDCNDNKIVYDVDNGECYGEGIVNEDEFAIQRNFMSENSKFRTHSHEENEILIIISGQLTAYFNNGYKTLLPGDVVYFSPNQEHSVIANKDTWIFGITKPSSKGYPDA